MAPPTALMTVSTVSGTWSTSTSSPTTAPETSATAWMMSASMTSAIARVTSPVYGCTPG
jgi:rhamnogalacturonyl hydrolase YesR